MNSFAENIMRQKYSWERNGSIENWENISFRVSKHVMKAVGAKKDLVQEVYKNILNMKFIPAGRYLHSAGKQYHQVQNCIALRAEDSREGWADLMNKAANSLLSGAGIGIDYSDVRPKGRTIRRTGGVSTGTVSLMQSINEIGRCSMQGGSRRSAIWAGLNWSHGDVFDFITAKDWKQNIKDAKELDYNFPAALDGTNISVQLDDEFFKAYQDEKHPKHTLATQIYWKVIEGMCRNGEPGFAIDIGEYKKETLKNACTEFTSEDDSDICNLGSINLANINSLDEMQDVVDASTAFLLAGTIYSDVPYAKVDQVRSKNRKIGLGLMGVHEFLLKRGKKYGDIQELLPYLEIYKKASDFANAWADSFEINHPKRTRAIAPTGSIGIIAETTTGIEPIFCVAYKRRFLKGDMVNYQYVVDPTAKRLIEQGVSPEVIEDAYDLSNDIERRIKFQAEMQDYVDMGISSTINLPQWGTANNNENTLRRFGETLMLYLPRLRGITAYPDGGRSGQPLSPVTYKTAMKNLDQVFVETMDVCDLAKKGSCG